MRKTKKNAFFLKLIYLYHEHFLNHVSGILDTHQISSQETSL